MDIQIRKQLEQLEYIKDKLEYIEYDEALGCYIEKQDGLPTGVAAWVNGAFYGFEQVAIARMEVRINTLDEILLNQGEALAQAKAQAVPEGFVVVPKDQIEVWWQDSEEPENFATKEDDLSFIAQHIQDDEIMEINEHHTIHLPSITKFGAWVYQSGQRTFFVGNKDEVEAVRGGNE